MTVMISPIIYGGIYRPYGACLDGRWFGAMRLVGDAKEICDGRAGFIRDTTVGVRTKQWCHWGKRSLTDSLWSYPGADGLPVRCFEEVRYERRIDDILHHLQMTPLPGWSRDLADLNGFARP